MINDSLLISCPGEDGGLFLAHGMESARLSWRPVTGLFMGNKKVLFAYQENGGNSIRISNGGSAMEQNLATDVMDLHDLLVVDDLIYAAVTEDNSVVCFDSGLNEVRSWALPGEKDSAHLNSVTYYRGQLLASVFGRFQRHRQYKEGTLGRGEVIDICSGQQFIGGLSQPHSLTVVDDLLYLCSSEDREIRIYRGSELIRKIAVPGYARGLAIGDKVIYVGLSMSRNSAATGQGSSTAAVGVIGKKEMNFEGMLNLACREIYDIRIINQDAWVLPHIFDRSLDGRRRYLEENFEAYKSGYEAYKSGYEAYKSGYEAYKSGYEAYKSGYEAYKSGYETYQGLENSVTGTVARSISRIEKKIHELMKYRSN